MTINEYQKLALRTDPLNSPYFAFGDDLREFLEKNLTRRMLVSWRDSWAFLAKAAKQQI